MKRFVMQLVSALMAAVVLGSVLIACEPKREIPKGSPPKIPLAGKVTPPAEGAYLGLFRPNAPFEIGMYDAYVASISKKRPAILMWYQSWGRSSQPDFDQGACVTTFQRDAIPMITWEPWDPGHNANFVEDPKNMPDYQLQDIVSGKFDPYIRSWARGIKTVGGPVMLRPLHEMNGNWYPWCGTVNGNTPAQFRRAWRHIHKLFKDEGVTNVTWVWSINSESIPRTSANRFAAYYPGDEYVDWTGISGFNWGTSRPGFKWYEFSRIYEESLTYLKTLDKPIVVAEFATVEGGGDKAEWITAAYSEVRTKHPQVKAIVYYDAYEERPKDFQDWRANTSPAATTAYQEAIGSPYFIAGPATPLSAWTAKLTPEDWYFLRSLPALY